eukprot:747805-Hanusia_phi.AAC.1
MMEREEETGTIELTELRVRSGEGRREGERARQEKQAWEKAKGDAREAVFPVKGQGRVWTGKGWIGAERIGVQEHQQT